MLSMASNTCLSSELVHPAWVAGLTRQSLVGVIQPVPGE
jgi:hypothetical protein